MSGGMTAQEVQEFAEDMRGCLARASAALTVLEGAYEARRPLSEIPAESLFRELGRRGLPLPDDDGVTDQDRAAYAAGREAGACAPARRSGRAVRRVRPS